MTITRCDSCMKEIPLMKDVFILQLWLWEKPSQMRRAELCEECAECLKAFFPKANYIRTLRSSEG